MSRAQLLALTILLVLFYGKVVAQEDYIISTVVGGIGDGYQATKAIIQPYGLALDSAGQFYVTDSLNNVIRKIYVNGTVDTIAGTMGSKVLSNSAIESSLENWKQVPLPSARHLVVDSEGNIYVAVPSSCAVLKLYANGTCRIFAGGVCGGLSDVNGKAAVGIAMDEPHGLAIDSKGYIYISERPNRRVTKVSPITGIMSLVAGCISIPTYYFQENVPANVSFLNYPKGIFIDSNDTLYISEEYYVRKVTSDGLISKLAGTGVSPTSETEGEGTLAKTARIGSISSVCLDSFGNIYLADTIYSTVKKINASTGILTTIVGALGAGNSEDGLHYSLIRIREPSHILFDGNGLLYIAAIHNYKVWKILQNGISISLIGMGDYGNSQLIVPAISATLSGPQGFALGNDEIYIANTNSNQIRKLKNNTLYAVAGGIGYDTDENSVALQSYLNTPVSPILDTSGQLIWIDGNNYKIKMLMTNGLVKTLAGAGGSGSTNGVATSSSIDKAYGLSLDSNGTLYIADTYNQILRQLQSNYVSTIAGITGNSDALSEDGQSALTTKLYYPRKAIFHQATGRTYFSGDSKIRYIGSDGLVYTLVGTGVLGYSNGGSIATSAKVNKVNDFVIDSSGNVIFVDTDNHLIRKVYSNGTIINISGSPVWPGYNGESIPAKTALLNFPYSIVLDSQENIYISDFGNRRIRKLTKVFDCFGLSVADPLVCSSHGFCVSQNNCSCQAGYFGERCENHACHSISNSNASVCSGHGYCSNPNVCACNSGYYGDLCEIYNCNSVLFNSSFVCSGNGTCKSSNNCSCNAGYYGDNCEMFNCNGTLFNNSNICSSQGQCISPNQCSCNLPYYGPNCEIFDCFGSPNNFSLVCSNHGVCSKPNNCTCFSGYSGQLCDFYNCFNTSFNSSNVCSSHGACDKPDHCVCENGYLGEDCSLYYCNGILFNNSQACSTNGLCISSNNCSCLPNYYGSNCELFQCNRIAFNSSSVCSSRGSCQSPNNCSCNNGYYGADCENFNCNGTLFNNSNVCSSHGVCNSPNNCSCSNGYYGNTCEMFNCHGIQKNDSSACSSNGLCTGFDTCNCFEGFAGSNCNVYGCGGIAFNSSNVCSSFGSCNSPNNCTCTQGYFGNDCELHNCFGILRNVSTVCSAHGSCLSRDNCTCFSGYYGTECQFYDCFGKKFNQSGVCSGNGACKDPNNCYCDEGFVSNNCSIDTRPFQITLNSSSATFYYGDNVIVNVEIVANLSDSYSNLKFEWKYPDTAHVWKVDKNFLSINTSTLDVGTYEFTAFAYINNPSPYPSRLSNNVTFTLTITSHSSLVSPKLVTYGIPTVLIASPTGLNALIISVTYNNSYIENLLGCSTSCSVNINYEWILSSSIFRIQSFGSTLAKYSGNNQISFYPYVVIETSFSSNSTVNFEFNIFTSQSKNLSSSILLPVISPPKPASPLSIFPNQGASLTDIFNITIVPWIADDSLQPLSYSIGYYDKINNKNIQLTKYSRSTNFNTYLPYIKQLTRSSQPIDLLVFAKDIFGNVQIDNSASALISPFTGAQSDILQILNSNSDNSLIVYLDQSVQQNLQIDSIIIDPKYPHSSLLVLELITSTVNNTLNQQASESIVSKLQSFFQNISRTYDEEVAAFGFVKSKLSNDDVSLSLVILSNLFDKVGFDNTRKVIDELAEVLYKGSIPNVLSDDTNELPSLLFKTSNINIVVSSFILPRFYQTSQYIADQSTRVDLNISNIILQYDALNKAIGVSIVGYSGNKYFNSISNNYTIPSSSVSDFKFRIGGAITKLSDLTQPIVLQFKLLANIDKSNLTSSNSSLLCNYFDETNLKWSSDGCYFKGYSPSYDLAYCACSHTTLFTTFLEQKTTKLTAVEIEQVSSLYYAQIGVGAFYLIIAVSVLIGLIALRNQQPIRSRLLTPYVGLIALIVECVLILIVQRSVLVSQLYNSTDQMWEAGDLASNYIANIVMIIINTLNLTAILSYVLQVARFQFMKMLYQKLSNRESSEKVIKLLRWTTSTVLFYSILAVFALLNIVYWTIWVALRRSGILTPSAYTYIVSTSYTACILLFGACITIVAIFDFILSTKKEIETKNKRHAVNLTQSRYSTRFEAGLTVIEKRKNTNKLKQFKDWLFTLDAPLFFRLEMIIYIISFILLILNQVIGLSSVSYRFENKLLFKLALTYDTVSFIFEALYLISYVLVFGGFSLIVAIIFKHKTPKRGKKQMNLKEIL